MTNNQEPNKYVVERQTVSLPEGFDPDKDTAVFEVNFAHQFGLRWHLVSVDRAAQRAVFERNRLLTDPTSAGPRDSVIIRTYLWLLAAFLLCIAMLADPFLAPIGWWGIAATIVAGIIAGVRFTRQTYGRKTR